MKSTSSKPKVTLERGILLRDIFINFGRSVGEVIFAEAKDGTGVVAIKKLQTVRRNKDRLPFILREIEIISSSAHDNIVRYIDCFDMGQELWVSSHNGAL